jgi:hypothetical protein
MTNPKGMDKKFLGKDFKDILDWNKRLENGN